MIGLGACAIAVRSFLKLKDGDMKSSSDCHFSDIFRDSDFHVSCRKVVSIILMKENQQRKRTRLRKDARRGKSRTKKRRRVP